MSLQALENSTTSSERLTLATTAIASGSRTIGARLRRFCSEFVAAMEESKRREGARLIRRYRHLLDTPTE